MAWTKEIIRQDNAVPVTHWEMISILYDHRRQKSTIVVGGWINQQAYQDNKQPIDVREYFIDAGTAPELAAGALAFVKAYVMAQEEFSGAVEIQE